MIDWERLKETSLAESLEPRPARDLRLNCRALYGGVAWPGKLAGFAVVLAMSRSRHFDSGDIYLLDEYETFDTRELVRQCDVLRFKYRVETWIGDIRNDAAQRQSSKWSSFIRTSSRKSRCCSTNNSGVSWFCEIARHAII